MPGPPLELEMAGACRFGDGFLTLFSKTQKEERANSSPCLKAGGLLGLKENEKEYIGICSNLGPGTGPVAGNCSRSLCRHFRPGQFPG